jgi:hypothetical protein
MCVMNSYTAYKALTCRCVVLWGRPAVLSADCGNGIMTVPWSEFILRCPTSDTSETLLEYPLYDSVLPARGSTVEDEVPVADDLNCEPAGLR